MGWKVEFLVDEFDTSKIQQEYENVKKHDKTYSGTAVINGKQVVDNIILNYSWAKITPLWLNYQTCRKQVILLIR